MVNVKKIICQKQIPAINGIHIYSNLSGINEELLTDIGFLLSTIKEAALAGNLHIIETLAKQFMLNGINAGVSIIALLEESHMSLHTWPEGNYAAFDVYSCGAESNSDAAFKYMVDVLKPTKIEMSKTLRNNL